MLHQYVSDAIYGGRRREKKSVRVDSEVGKPSSPNSGFTHELMAGCRHHIERGREAEKSCHIIFRINNFTTKISPILSKIMQLGNPGEAKE